MLKRLLALASALLFALAVPASAQAPVLEPFNLYIQTLPVATSPLGGTDKFYVMQGGISKQVAAATFGNVNSVSNSDLSLTISPTVGNVVASINLGNPNTWTVPQTFQNSGIRLLGSSTGYTSFASANSGASLFTLTFPAANDQLVGRATTDVLTHKTLTDVSNVIGTGVTISGGSAGCVMFQSVGTVLGCDSGFTYAGGGGSVVAGQVFTSGGNGGGGGFSINVAVGGNNWGFVDGGNNGLRFGFNNNPLWYAYSGPEIRHSGGVILSWAPTTPDGAADTVIGRGGVAALQQGAVDAASPVAQKLQVQSVATGTSNTAGTDWTFVGSKSTGNAAGGRILFKTSPAGGGGTSQNSPATALIIDSAGSIIAPGQISQVSGFYVFPDKSIGIEYSGASGNFMVLGANLLNRNDVGISPNTLELASAAQLGWCSAINVTAACPDTTLSRNAAGIVQLVNGTALTSATSFQVYNTTDTQSGAPTNYERGVLDWITNTNALTLGTQKGGTGSSRDIIIQRGGTNWATATIDGNGSVLVTPASVFTIAAQGATGTSLAITVNKGLGIGGFSSSGGTGAGGPFLVADSTAILSLAQSATAQTFRVYNTTDNAATPTNFERGVLDWTTTSNTFTIGTQAGGTGTGRAVKIVSAGNSLLVGDSSMQINFAGSLASFNVANGFMTTSSYGYLFSSGNGIGLPDSGIGRITAKVTGFADGIPGNTNGWMQWAGQARLDQDFSCSSGAGCSGGTTLTNITGSTHNLSVSVQAGRTYSFEAYLSFTDAAAGGIKAAIAGTATATAIEYDGWLLDSAANGVKGNTQATALATTVASSTTTGTAGVVQVKGTITVANAGTLTVQMAQNTANATNTTVKRGSYFIVQDMP